MFARRRDDTAPSSEHELASSLHEGWFGGAQPRYWLTRMLLLRALGFIYAIAFLVLVQQWRGLIGSRGILPAADFLARIRAHTPFAEWPTAFWLGASDGALGTIAVLGLLLSLAVLLGVDHAAILLVLWALYLSFCHVGQIFWGYGWEILLLEAGFLAVFLAPVRSLGTLRSVGPPPATAIWLLRWLLFRVMFGAGLIKLRGDPCWTELSCLDHHYETQPLPSPVSWLLHQAPSWFHRAGVLFNHGVDEDYINGTLAGLVFAGHETTKNQLGWMVAVLSEVPAEWDRVCAEPQRARDVIEEVLRFRSTATSVSRVADEPIELFGVPIAAGAQLQGSLWSANRDGAAFARPDAFDVEANRGGVQIAFGQGAHHCLGAALARAELQEALIALSARLHCPRLLPGATYLPALGITGPMTLPIAFEPRAAIDGMQQA
jgi:hypothetical protein